MPRRVHKSPDRPGVPGQGSEAGQGLNVPHAHGAIVGSREEASVGHRQSSHGIGVAYRVSILRAG